MKRRSCTPFVLMFYVRKLRLNHTNTRLLTKIIFLMLLTK
nr:MAG TPA: hypothetical protein [Caudoviricetes sp.]